MTMKNPLGSKRGRRWGNKPPKTPRTSVEHYFKNYNDLGSSEPFYDLREGYHAELEKVSGKGKITAVKGGKVI